MKKSREIRAEATDKVSTLSLTIPITSNGPKLQVHDLVVSAKDVAGTIDKRVKKLKKRKVLSTPLDSVKSGLIERRVNHEQVVKEVSKWQSVVDAHEVAPQLVFPLNLPSLHMETCSEVVQRYKKRNEMESKIDELLSSSKNNLKDDQILTDAEQEYLKAMDLETAREKYRQLQKMRVLLSYQESKIKRQKKIKSRNYHRLLKKDKLKMAVKEFEDLKSSDPEAALNKLHELDKIRILERASLRHRSTGKWAQHQKIRAANDDSVRDKLSEQVELSKQLTIKRIIDSSSESEVEEEEKEFQQQLNESEYDWKVPENFNPWMKSQKQLLEEQIKQKKEEELRNMSKSSKNGSKSNKKCSMEKNEDKNEIEDESANKTIKLTLQNSYFNKRKLDSDGEEADDSGNDDGDNDQSKLISEAFADDDVVVDFKKEKSNVSKQEQPKDVDGFLPGWGSWSGPGIDSETESIKKRKDKFLRKAPKLRRKDAKLGHVIISEKANSSIAKLQVRQLPFHFKSVPEFESSISQPIGRTWNPPLAVQALTEPQVVTRMGTIIEPMGPDSLMPAAPSGKSYAKMKKKAKKVVKSLRLKSTD